MQHTRTFLLQNPTHPGFEIPGYFYVHARVHVCHRAMDELHRPGIGGVNTPASGSVKPLPELLKGLGWLAPPVIDCGGVEWLSPKQHFGCMLVCHPSVRGIENDAFQLVGLFSPQRTSGGGSFFTPGNDDSMVSGECFTPGNSKFSSRGFFSLIPLSGRIWKEIMNE